MILRRPRVHLPRPRRVRAGGVRAPRAWLPGALTIGNLLAGYAAILAAAERRFLIAAVLILAAGVLDALDGRVARLTGATSEMGQQLDSLADAVSFAIAPSLLAFHMGLHTLGRLGYVVCFVFAACGVIRLARFNILPPDHLFFVGLPIPMAAAASVAPALVTEGGPLPQNLVVYDAVAVLVLAALMVSRIRYRSFKDVRFGPRPYRVLAVWASFLVCVALFHEWMIPATAGLYVLSPALFWAARRGRALVGRKARGAAPPPAGWSRGRSRESNEDDVLGG